MPAATEPCLQVPEEWESLALNRVSLTEARGVHIVVGAPDVGKSTFARYLYRKMAPNGRGAFLDGDPGQSALGPPSTHTLLVGAAPGNGIPRSGQVWRRFVGSVSPRGHLLLVLVSAGRFERKAVEVGASTMIFDTCGLVDPQQGGLALKSALIDLLQPRRVFAIQRGRELEPLLNYLRRSGRSEITTLAPAPTASPRSIGVRQEHRARQFADYFEGATVQWLDWWRYGVFPAPRFALNRLLALEDRDGFTQALGITVEIDRLGRRIALLSPALDWEKVRVLHLGDVLLDRQTWRDDPIEH